MRIGAVETPDCSDLLVFPLFLLVRFIRRKVEQGFTDWLPKPCKLGAHMRCSLREKQCRPTVNRSGVQCGNIFGLFSPQSSEEAAAHACSHSDAPQRAAAEGTRLPYDARQSKVLNRNSEWFVFRLIQKPAELCRANSATVIE